MKKIFLIIALLILPNLAHAKLNVVTTTQSLAAITREVGGDWITVKSLARGDQDPHFLEPKPSFVVIVSHADLLISIGLDLETGWLPVLLTQSRNPKIQKNTPGYLEASKGIPVLEIPTGNIDRSMGDVHPLGNPHYWLNPNNGGIMAASIANRLSELDPPHAKEYQERTALFQQRLRTKIPDWNRGFSSLRNVPLITHHKSFSYFIDWTGLKTIGYLEPKPGIPPSPGHLLKLTEEAKKQKVKLILSENHYDPQPGKKLSTKLGIPCLILSTEVGGDTGINDYFDLFEYLIQKITMSLRGT